MWKEYKKHAVQEIRPYILGEDLSGISVNAEDTPQLGGMIARNSTNHKDQWYVARYFFLDNYEPVKEYCCDADKFYRHIKGHLDIGHSVICKICDRTFEDIVGEEPE